MTFSDRKLYEDVNLKFTPGNCYGIIGANGAGKSTFLKIIQGELTPTTGTVSLSPNERMSSLRQDHFAFNTQTVMNTVLQGWERLYQVMTEKDAVKCRAFADENWWYLPVDAHLSGDRPDMLLDSLISLTR